MAALLGVIIGYLLGKASCPKTYNDDSENMKVSSITAKNTVPDTVEGIEPITLTGPRNGKKDNLTRIKGVGVKIEEELNKIGIYHFDQIADWNEAHIKWADSNLGFPGRAERENWVEQANALASGLETEFSKRVDAGKVSTSKQT